MCPKMEPYLLKTHGRPEKSEMWRGGADTRVCRLGTHAETFRLRANDAHTADFCDGPASAAANKRPDESGRGRQECLRHTPDV